MDKAQVAGILEEVGNLLELSGGNPWRGDVGKTIARVLVSLKMASQS
jgi:hypothetical protein